MGPTDAARGVMIEYYLAKASTSEVMFTNTDAGGEIIQKFSSRSKCSGSDYRSSISWWGFLN